MKDAERRTIWVKPSSFAPEFEMVIPIPTDRDDEEYIDELLDGILNNEVRYNIEWDFVDGLLVLTNTHRNGSQGGARHTARRLQTSIVLKVHD